MEQQRGCEPRSTPDWPPPAKPGEGAEGSTPSPRHSVALQADAVILDPVLSAPSVVLRHAALGNVGAKEPSP